MKYKIKDWKFWATTSVVSLILLCGAMIYHDGGFRSAYNIFYSPRLIGAFAVLFGISFLGFVISGTETDGIKKMLSIFVCSLALSGVFFFLMNGCYETSYGEKYLAGFGDVWKDLSILCGLIATASLVSILLLLIWRNPENKTNKKTN